MSNNYHEKISNEKACGAHIRTRSQTSYLDWVWHVRSNIKGHIGAVALLNIELPPLKGERSLGCTFLPFGQIIENVWMVTTEKDVRNILISKFTSAKGLTNSR